MRQIFFQNNSQKRDSFGRRCFNAVVIEIYEIYVLFISFDSFESFSPLDLISRHQQSNDDCHIFKDKAYNDKGMIETFLSYA